jgi:hypothetical protein
MGIFASRIEDPEVYRDTFEEAQRIIRISDEVRMSVETVQKEKKDTATNKPSKPKKVTSVDDSPTVSNNAKLSTSKIAVKLKMKTGEFLASLVESGLLIEKDNKHHITEQGKQAGGELKVSKRYGDYFIWPEDFAFNEKEKA